ncbi:MAG TPA: phenylacetic acid degradation protein PaaN [Streptosporangiales bacterium]
MPHQFYDTHRETLERSLTAIRDRGYWSPYPEIPKAYPEEAPAEGERAFQAYLGRRFPLDQPGTDDWIATERSPYGIELGVEYPHQDLGRAMASGLDAMPAWTAAGAETRAGVCLEILHRLNARTFELAHAAMHTTGQAYMMAFQAAGTHAQDRGLEAVAYAYAEMTRLPAEAYWEKPQGRRPPLRLRKRFHVVPRGLALLVACNTFPTWNSYPGLFASLVTGNAVLVKPHPRAVLPLAITVAVAREVLAEAGFSPDLVTLVPERDGEALATTLATNPAVRIVDFTGSKAYGNWLEEHARQAQVYTEKSGVNTIVVESTDDFAGMCRNIAFTLSLYAGQMCTTPQNIVLPRDGVDTDEGHKSADEVASGIAQAVDTLLSDDARAAEVLGAIVNEAVLDRLEHAGGTGRTLLGSRVVKHPKFPDAVVRTPHLAVVEPADPALTSECFGPVTYVTTAEDAAAAVSMLATTSHDQGAITASFYSTKEEVLDDAVDAAIAGGVHLSCNLTGGVYMNQTAAFSDFHATGANPAANASLVDGAFVAGRFRVVEVRRHAEPEGAGDA